MFKRFQFPIIAVLCGSLGLGFALGANALAQPAAAVVVDAGVPVAAPAPDAGSGSAATPAPVEDPLAQLADVKAKYDLLREAMRSKSPTLLLWAGMLAAAMKLLLSLFTRYVLKESKSWTKWIALGAAVPIALLAHYAGGFSLFDSLVFAGAGPGAIVIHELMKRKAE
jgi:hypothetical protein